VDKPDKSKMKNLKSFVGKVKKLNNVMALNVNNDNRKNVRKSFIMEYETNKFNRSELR
jgi:hypothetical protein